MKLIEFASHYPDEKSCRVVELHLKNLGRKKE
jgi:hypothetical protein